MDKVVCELFRLVRSGGTSNFCLDFTLNPILSTGRKLGRGYVGRQGGQLVLIEIKLERAGSNRCHLAQDDVLRDTIACIELGRGTGLEKNLDSLLKGASHERTGFVSVETVPGDGNQVALVGHQVNQQGQVAVVDVGAVKSNDVKDLLVQGAASSLDTEHGQDLDE